MSFFSGSTVWSRTGEAQMGGAGNQQKRGVFELNIGWEKKFGGLG